MLTGLRLSCFLYILIVVASKDLFVVIVVWYIRIRLLDCLLSTPTFLCVGVLVDAYAGSHENVLLLFDNRQQGYGGMRLW